MQKAPRGSDEIDSQRNQLTNLQSPELAPYWLSALIESADDAIISKTLDGIITSWNNGAQRIFGYTADEVIGKPITILIPEGHQDEEPVILLDCEPANASSTTKPCACERRKAHRHLAHSLTNQRSRMDTSSAPQRSPATSLNRRQARARSTKLLNV